MGWILGTFPNGVVIPPNKKLLSSSVFFFFLEVSRDPVFFTSLLSDVSFVVLLGDLKNPKLFSPVIIFFVFSNLEGLVIVDLFPFSLSTCTDISHIIVDVARVLYIGRVNDLRFLKFRFGTLGFAVVWGGNVFVVLVLLLIVEDLSIRLIDSS